MTDRKRVPDKKKALSLLEASKKDVKFTLSLKPTIDSSTTIVRNIYECFRMVGEAVLVVKGLESDDHKEQIGELIKLPASTTRPVQVIDNLRTLRHNVNYRGYRPTLAETSDAISIADSCFEPVWEEAHRIINAK